MQHNLRLILCFTISIAFFLPSTQAQLVNFEDTWQEFLSNNKISNISKLPKPNTQDYIDYAKYSLMYANTYFCSDDLKKAKEMITAIETVGEEKYKVIAGFKAKYDDLKLKMTAYHDAHTLWLNFLEYRNVTLEDLEKAAEANRVCEKGTLAKYSYMQAYAHYCNGDVEKARDKFENFTLKIVDKTSLKIGDVKGLEGEVKVMRKLFKDLKTLDPAWDELVKTGVSPGFDRDIPVIECFVEPSIKEYILKGSVDVCENGSEMLEKIAALQEKSSQNLSATITKKIKWMEKEVAKYDGDVAILNKAWKTFLPIDTLTGKLEFGYQYCDKANNIKAFTMTGMMNTCENGQPMLDSIAKVQKEFSPELDQETAAKVKQLTAKVKNLTEGDVANLNKVWAEFIENKDTLLGKYDVQSYYCDKILETKAMVIRGHFDYCTYGQAYLDKIDALQKEHELEYDEELACRVRRLRIKVWDCRYWELVVQARKETNAERERFGPQAASIMQTDLNSDQQPCETKVRYNPLGHIGVKYIISTFLCQDIDLAKMGDPEYYKKIATWVDTEVLQKYCEATMRCKEDFFIYLEGHTDGNRFGGARYKESLEIPMGTSFTHFWDGTAENKTTDREITTSLKNNMELGIARAWTVKSQLDFMGVPITIGAYEHPETEKGGEFRRIEIELNITNLLLDFYEKLLAKLLEESGIGERPEAC